VKAKREDELPDSKRWVTALHPTYFSAKQNRRKQCTVNKVQKISIHGETE